VMRSLRRRFNMIADSELGLLRELLQPGRGWKLGGRVAIIGRPCAPPPSTRDSHRDRGGESLCNNAGVGEVGST